MTAPTEKAAPIPADGLVDAVAKAISSHGYTEQVKGDGFAWWWNSLHDHPGNVFAHECREDDRAKARLALHVIMQDRADRADREARPSLPDSREERENDLDAERYRYLRDNCVRKWRSNIGAPDSLSIDYDADGHDLSAALDASLDRDRARQGGNNGRSNDEAHHGD